MGSDHLQPGQELEGTYRIVGRIGGGAMGEVWEATHARLAGRYAIKLLLREIAADPGLMARFEREARVTSSLRHPNIVQVLDFRQLPDGTPYIVMEHLEGTDLAAEIQRSGPLPLARVAGLVDQIASGLAAAHEAGIVHRDLKPANLFLVVLPGSRRELVKIVDFGISKVRASETQLTRTATVMGTPQYMAPEQAQGQADQIDARTDQFSLAAIAYEMIAGRCPFAGDTIPAVMYQLVHVDPPPLPVGGQPVGAELEAVLRRGLAKRPEDRYASVLDFSRAFEAAATASVVVASASVAVASAPPAVPETALGRGAGEARAGAPAPAPATAGKPRGARRAVAAGGAAVATIAVVLGVALKVGCGPSSSAPPPAPAAAPVAAPAAHARPPQPGEQITIEVTDAPPGLVVAIDGASPAPPPAHLAKGSGTHQMVFRAPGFKSKTLQLDASKDLAVVLSLAKGSDGARAEQAAAPAPKKRKSGRFRHDVDSATGFVKRHFGTGGN